MIIKKPSGSNFIKEILFFFSIRFSFKIIVILFFFILFSFTLISFGIYLHRSKNVQNLIHYSYDIYKTNIKFISNYFSYFNSNPENINLDIKFIFSGFELKYEK